MAKAAKAGIRVSVLAKELGVDSKAILAKLRDEGLGDEVPNHQSVIKLGLAESVREWFAHGSSAVSTAVETAAHVEVLTKPKVSRKKTKTSEIAEPAAPAAPEIPAAPEPAAPAPVEAAPAPEVPATPAVETEAAAKHRRARKKAAEAHVEPAGEAPAVTVEPAAPAAPSEIAPAPIVAETPAAVEPLPSASAEAAATTEAHAAGKSHAAHRPTVTLKDRPTKRAVPVVKPFVPEPAKIQGPRVVREEQPDIVSAPRPRGPRPGTGTPPGFTAAKPVGGRGVKRTEGEEEGEAAKKANRSLSNRRRGPDGRRGEADEKLREFSEADLAERKERLAAASTHRRAFDDHLKKTERGPLGPSKTAIQRGEPVSISEPITVKSLSAVLGIKSNQIITALMKKGVFVTINQGLSRDVAEGIALERGIELKVEQEKTLEEQMQHDFASLPVEESRLVARPPVVTILGHVDHGKTSLLDKIRHANVAAGEAGGITQHTAAWMVELGEGEAKKRVTFIDTPGHQAFTSMRARGAAVTDVVVLVVSAAEGVQPQTIESINHARAAGVPIVVAMNKIDRADANPDMVLGQLAKEGLNPVEWGGDTEVIRTSATTGKGIPDLIEILDYQAELLALKADPDAPARGTVIESRVDEGLGAVATVLVQNGTLRLGDIILAGPGYGRVRSLLNDRGQNIDEAGPSMPVIVSGLDELPNAGEKFQVLADKEQAREVAEERQTLVRQKHLVGRNIVTAESVFASLKAADVQTINLIIKADVQGSAETLVNSIGGQQSEEIKLRVIHSGVGAISESDVELAMATRAKPTDNKVAIIGFHVIIDETARGLAEQNHIDVKLYQVIYEIFDDLKKAMSGMLTPEEREKLHGHAEVRQVFKVSRVGNVAGCFVTDGHIQRGSKIRLVRNGAVITEGLSLESLRRLKDDAKEVKSGLECGIKLAGYDDIKVGDVFEAYIREKFERTL